MMSEGQAASAFDTIIQRSMTDDVPHIMFSDIRPYLEQGAGRQSILEKFPRLMEKKVFTAKGLYDAKVTARPLNRAAGTLHVLCDENISPRHVRACQRLFGYATSISFESMQASTDQQVWDYAVQNKFDLIITQDRRNRKPKKRKNGPKPVYIDLTAIAEEGWRDALLDPAIAPEELPKLPLVLHLLGDARDTKKFGRIAAQNLQDIFNAHASLDAPVLRLAESGLYSGTRTFSLLQDMPDGPVIVKRSRAECWARFFLQKILPDQKTWHDRDDPDVRRRKRDITRAVAIARKSRSVSPA